MKSVILYIVRNIYKQTSILTSWSTMSTATESLPRKHARWPKRSHLSGARPRHSTPSGCRSGQRTERCWSDGHMAECVGRPQHWVAASHAATNGRFAVAVRWRRAAGVVCIAIAVVRTQIFDVDDGVLLIGVVVDVRFV